MQTRLTRKIEEAQTEIERTEATDSPYAQILEMALDRIRCARDTYGEADDYARRLLNKELIERIEFKGWPAGEGRAEDALPRPFLVGGCR